MNTHSFDVAVAGGGPVGAAIALGLRARGFSVALIERAPAPAAFDAALYDPRVYAISAQSAHFLEGLGVWTAIARDRVSPYASMKVWRRDPARALCFDAGDAAAAQLGWIVEHGLIVSALWSALDREAVFLGSTIADADFSAGGARLRLADGREIRARLAVAADGGHSALREAAGIQTAGWAYTQQAIVCHVETRMPHRATAWQRFLDSGPLAFLPLADGRSSIVWSAEAALAAELLALDDEAFRGRLGEASEQVLGDILASTRRLSFPLSLHHALDYAGPGLVLAGDAAHGIHPLAGQGVNLGFGDAQALIELLAATRKAGRDWGSPRCLAAYARARKAANLEMQGMTDLLYRAFRSSVPGVKTALGLGLELLNRSGLPRSLLARRATGA